MYIRTVNSTSTTNSLLKLQYKLIYYPEYEINSIQPLFGHSNLKQAANKNGKFFIIPLYHITAMTGLKIAISTSGDSLTHSSHPAIAQMLSTLCCSSCPHF